MDTTLNEFMTAMVSKVNALVSANDRREKPWGRRDFVMYIKGAVDLYLFMTGNPENADADCVMSNIYIDSDVCDLIPISQ